MGLRPPIKPTRVGKVFQATPIPPRRAFGWGKGAGGLPPALLGMHSWRLSKKAIKKSTKGFFDFSFSVFILLLG